MNIYEEILAKYTPEIDENGMIKIVPLNQFEWRVIPINENDNVLFISVDDFVCVTQRYAQFNAELNAVIPFNKTEFKEFLKSKGYATSKED